MLSEKYFLLIRLDWVLNLIKIRYIDFFFFKHIAIGIIHQEKEENWNSNWILRSKSGSQSSQSVTFLIYFVKSFPML